jgi:hypothetical protein
MAATAARSIAQVVIGSRVVDEQPYTPASDYPRERIAAGLCPLCPDGRGVTTGWNGTTELLKCDQPKCWGRWFRGHRYRQPPLFEVS